MTTAPAHARTHGCRSDAYTRPEGPPRPRQADTVRQRAATMTDFTQPPSSGTVRPGRTGTVAVLGPRSAGTERLLQRMLAALDTPLAPRPSDPSREIDQQLLQRLGVSIAATPRAPISAGWRRDPHLAEARASLRALCARRTPAGALELDPSLTLLYRFWTAVTPQPLLAVVLVPEPMAAADYAAVAGDGDGRRRAARVPSSSSAPRCFLQAAARRSSPSSTKRGPRRTSTWLPRRSPVSSPIRAQWWTGRTTICPRLRSRPCCPRCDSCGTPRATARARIAGSRRADLGQPSPWGGELLRLRADGEHLARGLVWASRQLAVRARDRPHAPAPRSRPRVARRRRRSVPRTAAGRAVPPGRERGPPRLPPVAHRAARPDRDRWAERCAAATPAHPGAAARDTTCLGADAGLQTAALGARTRRRVGPRTTPWRLAALHL